MGFSEAIGKFLSKFFKPQEGWELEMTESQIKDMEAQGVDVTEIRAKRVDYLAAMEKEEREIREASLNALEMSKLQPYLASPRDAASEFVTDALALNDLKEKYREKFANAPLIYCSIVQAHNGLWKPNFDEIGGVVYVFAMDDAHIHNEDWLRELAEKISEMRDSSQVPAGCEKIVKKLNDEKSDFCIKLDSSLVGDADAWCATHAILDAKDTLPLGYLPYSKIMPLFMLDSPQDNAYANFRNVPVKYYTK